jgi:hypothetical protein
LESLFETLTGARESNKFSKGFENFISFEAIHTNHQLPGGEESCFDIKILAISWEGLIDPYIYSNTGLFNTNDTTIA